MPNLRFAIQCFPIMTFLCHRIVRVGTSRYRTRVYSLCAALSTVQELFITSPRVRTSHLSYYLRQTSPC